jgi:hypothetical protein
MKVYMKEVVHSARIPLRDTTGDQLTVQIRCGGSNKKLAIPSPIKNIQTVKLNED